MLEVPEQFSNGNQEKNARWKRMTSGVGLYPCIIKKRRDYLPLKEFKILEDNNPLFPDPSEETLAPIFNESNAEAAVAAGCPESLIDELRQIHESRLSEWKEKEAKRTDFVNAIESAKEILKAPSEIPSKVRRVFIFPTETPKPTQYLDDSCIEMFNREWEKIKEMLSPEGVNNHYLWVEIPPDWEIPQIIAHSGDSKMEYHFYRRQFKSRIFVGELKCGNHSPH